VHTELGRSQVEVQRCTLSWEVGKWQRAWRRVGKAEVEVQVDADMVEEKLEEEAEEEEEKAEDEEEEDEEDSKPRRRTILIKSNNLHLAGGEKHICGFHCLSKIFNLSCNMLFLLIESAFIPLAIMIPNGLIKHGN